MAAKNLASSNLEGLVKRLLVARHAKAEFNDRLDDIDRPLNSKGIEDCKIASLAIKSSSYIPELIICSLAKRSFDTAKNIIDELPNKCKIQIANNLYQASKNDTMNLIESIDEKYSIVMIVGHNPTITEVVAECARNSNITKHEEVMINTGMNPASISLFSFDSLVSWSDLRKAKSEMKWIFRSI